MNILSNSVNSGEISPLVDIRQDQPRRANGCVVLENFLPRVYGGAHRRPGLEYIGQLKQAGAILQRFQFSVEVSYVIEFGEGYMRFWKSDGTPVLGGDDLVVEVMTPYQFSDLRTVRYAQANDIVYFAHGNHPVHKLSRVTETLWTFEAINYGASGNWPPLLDPNVEDITITPTAAATQGVNWKYYEFSGTPTPTELRNHFVAGGSANATGTSNQPKVGMHGSVRSDNWGYYVTLYLDCATTGTYTFFTTSDDKAAIWVNGTRIVVQNTVGAEASGSVSLTAGRHYIELAFIEYSGTATWDAATAFVWTPPGGAKAMVPTTAQWTSQFTSATFVANADIFQAGHVGSVWSLGHVRANTSTKLDIASTGTSAVFRVMGTWSLETGGTWHGKLNLERSRDGVNNWQIARSYESLQNSPRNVTTSGNEETETYLRLVFVDGTGTDAGNPYAILEAGDPVIYSLARITAFTDARNVTVETINGLYSTAATTNWAEGAWSNVQGYPEALVFHQQGLYFARGQNIWRSQLGNWDNFRFSSLDDSAFMRLLGAMESNKIRWMASIGGKLVAGTNADEWVIDGGENSRIITPSDFYANPENSIGSSFVPAVMANDAMLFLQGNGRGWRELVYSFADDSFVAPDMNLMGEHVLGSGCISAAIQRQDDSILWCVTADGGLASMNYDRPQEMTAWARHSTLNGEFRSVVTIAGGDNKPDQVWFTLSREIGDNQYIYTIERFHPETMIWTSALEPGPCYLDCATVLENTDFIPAALTERFGGEPLPPFQPLICTNKDSFFVGDNLLWPTLEGQDGLYLGSLKETIVIGIPYPSSAQPVYPNLDLQDGTGFKRLHRVNATEIHYRTARNFAVAMSRKGFLFRRTDIDAWDLVDGIRVQNIGIAGVTGDIFVDMYHKEVNLYQTPGGVFRAEKQSGAHPWRIYYEATPGAGGPHIQANEVTEHPWQVTQWNTSGGTPIVGAQVYFQPLKTEERVSYNGYREILWDAGMNQDVTLKVIVEAPFSFYLLAIVWKLDAYGK